MGSKPPKRTGRRPRPAFDPWSDLEWEEHREAMKIVRDHRDGMTLEEVGEVLGVTRERVRQIEAMAFKKLKANAGGAVVMLDGFAIPLVLCVRCGEYFVREPRTKYCPPCRPHAPKRRKPARAPVRPAMPPPSHARAPALDIPRPPRLPGDPPGRRSLQTPPSGVSIDHFGDDDPTL